jgi:hypothetical protein
MSVQNKLNVAVLVLALGGLSACTQMPTEKQSVVDQRPQISFRLAGAPQQAANARVFVDDLDVGRVGDFVDGQASLRVLPGTHLIKVQLGEQVMLLERAYLGDGVLRPFSIK